MNIQNQEETQTFSNFETHLENQSKIKANDYLLQLETLQLLGKAIKETDFKGMLFPFGSFCNGFQSNAGDLDCVFITEEYQFEGRNILQKIAQKISNLRKNIIEFKELEVKQKILHARVPILKIYHEKNSIHIDLSVNNINGIVNSRLLFEFSQLHPKISQLGILLKLWGKCKQIIVTGFVTSYSMILLMIHFLQAKYNVPLLHYDDLSDKQFGQLEQVENNPFFQIDKTANLKKLSQSTLSDLLIDFFQYYEPNGEFEKKKICVSLTKDAKQNKDYRRTIKIQDPINMRNDPSKNFKKDCYFLQDQFYEAKIQIQEGNFDFFHSKRQIKNAEKKIQIQQDQLNGQPVQTQEQVMKQQLKQYIEQKRNTKTNKRNNFDKLKKDQKEKRRNKQKKGQQVSQPQKKSESKDNNNYIWSAKEVQKEI